MGNDVANPDEPERLAEEDLSEVSGGLSWDASYEKYWQRLYRDAGCPGTFEDFYLSHWADRDMSESSLEHMKGRLVARNA